MSSLNQDLSEYRNQLQQGHIQRAYRAVIDTLNKLRSQFKDHHSEYTFPGSLYAGYMDMSYFSITDKELKARELKIAVVFLHEAFRFEVWLAGVNKQVQAQIWQLIREKGWTKYPLVTSVQGADAIIEHVLVVEPDFSDLSALTAQIESQTVDFIKDCTAFLTQN
jgi:hypothetical protein